MTDLDLIYSSVILNKTIVKLDSSIKDFELKMPHRTDIIQSMNESKSELTQAYVVYKSLEKEYRASQQRNNDLETVCMNQQIELNEIRKINKELIDGL